MSDQKKRKRTVILSIARKHIQHHVEKTKNEVKETADDAATGSSSDEYAQNTLDTAMKDVGTSATGMTQQTARLSYAKYKAFQDKREKKIAELTASEHPSVEAEPFLKKEHEFSREPQPKAKVTSEKNRKQMKQEYIKKQSAKKYFSEGKAAKRGARQIQNTAVSSTTQKARETFGKTAEKIGAVVRKMAAKTVRTVASLLAMMGPIGAIIAIIILFAGVVAVVFGSPMGILFAGESNDPNAISISSIVQETNEAFGEAINEIVAEHPECDNIDIKYDYEDGHTWASYWPEVLAVFSINTNLNSDKDVIVIDADKKQQLEDTFWLMHQIDSKVEKTETEIEVPNESKEETEQSANESTTDTSNQEDTGTHTEIQISYTLHITVSSKTVDELAAEYRFTQNQLDIMHELLSDEMRPYLVSLAGTGTIIAPAGLQWPLLGYSYISTHFGVPDAFGKPGHKGIDIPAPAGTPILAAHGGTVLVATTSDSYGNQVLIDSGEGVATRYAHMTNYIVSPGQLVTAGEVIGYVGSTGASTGNHLHFETSINGQLADPLTWY